jgi:hypothetical protein
MARYQNSVTLDDTGVTPGSYTNANIVVNSKGLVISASDGSNGSGGPSGSLDDLVDVNVSTATVGQTLTFNGSIWYASDFNLDSLGDVSTSAPNAGHVLYYNGSTWVNGPASANNILDTNTIGDTVQGFHENLESISLLTSSPGFVVYNGSSIQKVEVTAATNGGLAITNGDASTTPIQISMDLTNLPSNPAVSSADELVIYDVSTSTSSKAPISDILVAGGAIVNGMNLGSGADVFILAQNGIAQFRGIFSGSSGIVIDTDINDILIGLSDSLESLSIANPANGNFLVGNGTQWASRTTLEAKTVFGFGTMADEDAADYLPLSGGTMAGMIDMGNAHSINGLIDPVNNDQAANKAYVDAQVTNGITAGSGLTKTGNTININSMDSSITVNADDIQINTAFTDNLYHTKSVLASSILNSEGADLVGTSVKSALGNSISVEEALVYIDNYFANLLPKFSMDLSAIWNLDVGVPNVNGLPVRDTQTAVFENVGDSAIYVDFVIPQNYDITAPLTFYANLAKATASAGVVEFGLAYQYQRPNVAPANYPARGPAPNWDFTVNEYQSFSNADDLLHTLTWVIPANTFQPLDTVTLRFSRMITNGVDTYADEVRLFTTLISQ